MPDSPRRSLRITRPGRQSRRLRGREADENQLRKLFNDGGILERVKRGEYTASPVEDSHPKPPRADEPECTRSQLIAYYDPGGKKVAEAHQYLRPDGTIGASGKPDPKEVVHEGVLYYLPD